jgi:hypothetical protein
MLFLNDGKAIFEGKPLVGLKDRKIRQVLGSYDEILNLIKKNI